MKLGKLSENALKRSVLRQMNRRRKEVLHGAGMGEDCAIFAFSEGALCTCVVSGVLESVGECAAWGEFAEQISEKDSGKCRVSGVGKQETAGIGAEECDILLRVEHLLQRCANKLAANRAEPVGVMLSFTLPASLEEPAMKEFMVQADLKCKELNVEIAGVHTSVSAAVTSPLLTVTGMGRAVVPGGKDGAERSASGKGRAEREASLSAGAAEAGQDIVISKWIGLEGTARLAKENREKLLGRYPAYLVEEAAGFDKYLSIIPEAATAMKSGVCAMHDASEGGIFRCLWELAERAGVGLTIDMRKLPLRQETVEVCELCGVNPYEMLSGGCLVMTTRDGQGLVNALEEANIPAVIVGKITDSNDRILINGEEVRYMDKPHQDELYRCV